MQQPEWIRMIKNESTYAFELTILHFVIKRKSILIVEYSSDVIVYVCILHLLCYKMYEKRSQINKLRKVQNINI